MHFVLGLGGYSHDASAAIVVDGKVVAAVQEERLTRIKHVGGFPVESIKYCLREAGIEKRAVSAIAFYARKSNWDQYLFDAIKAAIRYPTVSLSNPKGTVATIGYRVQKSVNFRADYARFFIESGFSHRLFHAHDHHACHAAAGYFASPFDHAIVLCVDGGGDSKTTTGWQGRGLRLTPLPLEVRHPHSLGLIYTRVTRFLGFSSSGDEYKVMGLASYGKPKRIAEMRKLVQLVPDGTFRLNMEYFVHQFDHALSPRFYEVFGPARKPDEEITEHHADIAASAQALFEEALQHLAVALRDRAGVRNLVFSGGSALNCTAAGKLLVSGLFDNVFVPATASDVGTSIGAAQYHSYMCRGVAERHPLRTDELGPAFSDEEVAAEIRRSGVPHVRVPHPERTAAELIAAGHIVGWHQGRMEFGPRALGSRSILADPRRNDVKDRVNSTVKFREQFRPFAPSVLRQHVREYFGVDGDFPFMTHTLKADPAKAHLIPGVVHVDGTSRVQTVSREHQPLYYALIEHFHRLTGIPIVLNTSFNLAGEPIVCSPYDSVRTFYSSGIDYLVMGSYVLAKRKLPDVAVAARPDVTAVTS